jgi:hypothetical protein
MLPSPDPTGLSSSLGQLAILAGLVAALVVAGRWWWHQHKR